MTLKLNIEDKYNYNYKIIESPDNSSENQLSYNDFPCNWYCSDKEIEKSVNKDKDKDKENDKYNLYKYSLCSNSCKLC